jgi:hypothetical protein
MTGGDWTDQDESSSLPSEVSPIVNIKQYENGPR